MKFGTRRKVSKNFGTRTVVKNGETKSKQE